jgi:hypothetical protein
LNVETVENLDKLFAAAGLPVPRIVENLGKESEQPVGPKASSPVSTSQSPGFPQLPHNPEEPARRAVRAHQTKHELIDLLIDVWNCPHCAEMSAGPVRRFRQADITTVETCAKCKHETMVTWPKSDGPKG